MILPGHVAQDARSIVFDVSMASTIDAMIQLINIWAEKFMQWRPKTVLWHQRLLPFTRINIQMSLTHPMYIQYHIQSMHYLGVPVRNLDPFLCNGAQVCSSPAVHGPFLFACFDFCRIHCYTPSLPHHAASKRNKTTLDTNQKPQCVRFNDHATYPHRSHCPPKRRLHGTLLHGASDAASTFSCISKKRCLKYAPGFWDTDLVPPKTMSGSPEPNSAREARRRKTIRGQESLHNLRIDDSMEAGPASGPRCARRF